MRLPCVGPGHITTKHQTWPSEVPVTYFYQESFSKAYLFYPHQILPVEVSNPVPSPVLKESWGVLSSCILSSLSSSTYVLGWYADCKPWLIWSLGTSSLPSPQPARESGGKAVEPKGEELGSEVRQVDSKLPARPLASCVTSARA